MHAWFLSNKYTNYFVLSANYKLKFFGDGWFAESCHLSLKAKTELHMHQTEKFVAYCNICNTGRNEILRQMAVLLYIVLCIFPLWQHIKANSYEAQE